MAPSKSNFYHCNGFVQKFHISRRIHTKLIIATILRWKEMQTPCNLLMINIAKYRDRGPGSELWKFTTTGPSGTSCAGPSLLYKMSSCVCVCVRCHSHNNSFGTERYRAIVKAIMNKVSVTITRAVICVTWFSCHGLSYQDVISNAEQQNGQIFCAISFLSKTFHRLSNKLPDLGVHQHEPSRQK